MSSSNPTDLNASVRAQQALRLRAYGVTYEQIRQRCGYETVSAAKMAVKRLREKHEIEAVNDYRIILGGRLDDMAAILEPRIAAGDLWAYDRMLAITEQQRKLFGADAPTEAEKNATPYSKRITIHRAATPSESPQNDAQVAL